MDLNEFNLFAKYIIDWISSYFNDIENNSVKSSVQPGEIYNKLPKLPPILTEKFDDIFDDFQKIIMPGMTHWQHPRFFAYFPANNSYQSQLAEMLVTAIGAQCMVWQTSPSAAELEELVMNWLLDMIGIKSKYFGVIQDTASTATLCSILTAREKYSDYQINENGFSTQPVFRVYCSTEAHSSIEKAVKIAGIGRNNLIKISVDKDFSMDSDILETAILNDLSKDYVPLCVVAAFGTTGSTAIDPIEKIGAICKKFKIWYHIDAAFAGSALILPEYQHYAKAFELADTFVFNPHKWLFTNFDCSAYFVKSKEDLIRTFEIMPEYLKTNVDDHVNNYRDWGIQLGRRFRALKLWFVIRSFGVMGLQDKIRLHIKLANDLKLKIESDINFEILAPIYFNVLCFRYKPKEIESEEKINAINEMILNKVNDTGFAYITHTKLNGKFTLRFVIAQTKLDERHVTETWNLIRKTALEIDLA